jgi:hypothetical protein
MVYFDYPDQVSNFLSGTTVISQKKSNLTFPTGAHPTMSISTLRTISEPALIQQLAEYLEVNKITELPDWLSSHFPDMELAEIRSWWYMQASSNIYHYHRIPMLRPRLSQSWKSRATESMIEQFQNLGWIWFDRTGIMLVSKNFERVMLEIVRKSRNQRGE